jgi:hypothetical protein
MLTEASMESHMYFVLYVCLMSVADDQCMRQLTGAPCGLPVVDAHTQGFEARRGYEAEGRRPLACAAEQNVP